MKASVYNQAGKETRTLELPGDVFGLSWNADLVHQVVTAMESNARKPIAHTKGRGEVSGGGKKPWKQKGTGRARHGSIRSPIWKGGGITHGPTNERVFTRKINRQTKVAAVFTVLSRKVKDGELVLVDALTFTAPKTKEAALALLNLATAANAPSLSWKNGKRALVLVPKGDINTKKSFRNIPSVLVEEVRNVNPVDLVRYKYVVLANPEESFTVLTQRAR